MEDRPKRVFIPYARSTSAHHARALHAAIGADDCFLDSGDIPADSEFPKHLADALLQCVSASSNPHTRWPTD
jgi:hypothetical protein